MMVLDKEKALRLSHGFGQDLADHLATQRPDFYLLLSKYPAPAVALQDLAFCIGGGLFLNQIAVDCLAEWGYLRPADRWDGPLELMSRFTNIQAGDLDFFTYGDRVSQRLAFPDLLARYKPPWEDEQVDLVFRQRHLQLVKDCGLILGHVFSGCASLGQLRDELRYIPELDALLALLVKCRYLAWEGDRLLILVPFIGQDQSNLLCECFNLLLSSLFSWHQHNVTLVRASVEELGLQPDAAYGYLWPAMVGYCSLYLSRVGFFASPEQGFLAGIVERDVFAGVRARILEKARGFLKDGV